MKRLNSRTPTAWQYSPNRLSLGWLRCLIGFSLAWMLGVRVLAQPEFFLHPQSQTVPAGSKVVFTADVDGFPPLLVLWLKDGQPLADEGRIQGAETTRLSISQVTPQDAGVYELAAEDFFGDIAFSNPAQLTVNGGGGQVLPQITTQPRSETVVPGGQVVFTVSASGTAPLVYQWRFKTFDIPGADGPSLTLRDLQAANAGEYRVVVSNGAGSVTSDPAILTVSTGGGGPGPEPGVFRLVAQPQKLQVQVGNPATFTVAAAGGSNPTYQWRNEGVNIPGATQPTYRIPRVVAADAAGYSAVVRNGTNQITSETALLAVESAFPVPADNTWTILVYGHGDHNLSPSLIADMNEMEAVGSGTGFNIVVQADFNAQEQRLEGLPNELRAGVTRMLMRPDATTQNLTSPAVERLPELNLDDPKVLEAFLVWGIQKYPAKRYGLVYWDHGGQWVGFGGDSQDNTLQNNGILQTREIRDAMQKAMQTTGLKRWDFIGFDTCLMGGVEILVDFERLTDLFIACPEIDYGDGWDYEAAFRYLKQKPNATPREFGVAEVDTWGKHHMVERNRSDLLLAAHAAYDLTQFNPVTAQLNRLGGLAGIGLAADQSVLRNARSGVTHYGLTTRDLGKPTDYIDLGEFAARVGAGSGGSTELRAAANELLAAIDGLVIAKVLGSDKQKAHGLSVYHPVGGIRTDSKYLDLTYTLEPRSTWPIYLQKVSGAVATDAPPLPPTPAEGNPGPGGPAPLIASLVRPARFSFNIAGGNDLYRYAAAVADNTVTGDATKFLYWGQIANQPVNAAGEYQFDWNGTIPALLGAAGEQVALGSFYLEDTTDLLISFAEYSPPNASYSFFVSLLGSQSPDGRLTLLGAMDAEDPESAPRGVDLEPGGSLRPLYFIEERQGPDPELWPVDFVVADTAVRLPTNGIEGLRLGFESLLPKTYVVTLLVEDYFEQGSQLDYSVKIIAEGPAPGGNRLSVVRPGPGQLVVEWLASNGGNKLQSAASASGPWTDVALNLIVAQGDKFRLEITPQEKAYFYR